jgi:hypothetical protein
LKSGPRHAGCRPNIVKFETTPDERRILDAARLASVTLRRTFDKWMTMGRGLQLLRKKADQIGTRNAFNDLRDQPIVNRRAVETECLADSFRALPLLNRRLMSSSMS